MTHARQIACTKKRIEITLKELPLSCPLPQQRIWDAHPRVYLPIEETGKAECPYCGAEYFLTDFNPTKAE